MYTEIFWQIVKENWGLYCRHFFCRITEYLLLSKKRIEKGKKITDSTDRIMTELDQHYIAAAKSILNKMFPEEKDMEMEYQFLAAKLFIAKTCTVQARVQDDELMELVEDYISVVFTVMQKDNTIKRRELEKQIATFFKESQSKT